MGRLPTSQNRRSLNAVLSMEACVEQKMLEVFSETSNSGVVRMPGRAYPGSVIQGDSLSILCCLARAIRQRASASGDAELLEDASELAELLEDRRHHYESVLGDHGLTLPYTKME